MSQQSIENFMQEIATYNKNHYEPPSSSDVPELLEAMRTASIQFFSDGSAEFYDKDGTPIKGHSLIEIYEWLLEENKV